MPIYEYRCGKCGNEQEFLQKVSERPIARCPACGSSKFQKKLSAAGFQLKGSGWYATDFKGGKKPAEKADAPKSEAKPEAKSESKPETKTAAKSKAPAATS